LSGPSKFIAVCAIAAGALCGCSSRASAQPAHAWAVSIGYAPLHDGTDHVTFPAGVSIGGSMALRPWLAVVADVDHQRKTLPSFFSDITLTSTGVMAGARASSRIGAFTEFVQVMAGGVSSTGTLFGTTDTTNHVAVQPGIGLDYALGTRWAARGELDIRWLSTGNELRYVAALVYRLH
jgi:hypothetical protein